MNEILEGKGLVRVAEDTVHVTGMRGPLEDGWREKVEAFASRIAGGAAHVANPEPDEGTHTPPHGDPLLQRTHA